MKSLSYVLALFLILSSCNNTTKVEAENPTEKVSEEPEMYNGMPISEKEPDNYTGEFLELYKNGLPKIRGHKVDGIRQGKWEGYQFTGTKASEAFYVDGKEDGIYTVFHDNGKVRYKGKYDMGQKIGVWKYFSEEGELIRDTVYQD